jgi:hypothetical protein
LVAWPPQGLYVKKEIASVADMRGLKWRAYSPSTAKVAELIGAQPVTVQAAELPHHVEAIGDLTILQFRSGERGDRQGHVLQLGGHALRGNSHFLKAGIGCRSLGHSCRGLQHQTDGAAVPPGRPRRLPDARHQIEDAELHLQDPLRPCRHEAVERLTA